MKNKKNWSVEWNGEGIWKNGRLTFGKLFWGILLILIAVFLILDKIGIIKGIGIWTIIFSMIFGVMLINGLMKRSWGSIFFSIAFLSIVYDEQLGITVLTPWTVLLAALLLTIGMNLLFHKKSRYRKYIDFMRDGTEYHGMEGMSREDNVSGGEKIFHLNQFCSMSKYINPEEFSKGMFENSFGEMNIYFENVITKNKEGFLKIVNTCGEMNLYIPSSWYAKVNVKTSFGETRIHGDGDDSRSFILYVDGTCSFGEVNIIYQ